MMGPQAPARESMQQGGTAMSRRAPPGVAYVRSKRRSGALTEKTPSGVLLRLGEPMRREFIEWIVGSATAGPLAARAQQSAKIARIGFLGPASASATANLKSAKALRLEFPPTLLSRADTVIE
jgi:hypothetical protein